MATSNDHPGMPFVQAAGYTRGRPDGPPIWIVIHDMEASEHSERAESTAAYFANPGDGRSVSSHYCVDNDSVVQCVDLDDTAWTVGNRPGNNRGINWELSGFASQTGEQWLDPFGKAMFAQMAPIVRSDSARFGIPIRKLSVTELKSFTPGVTSHHELGIAFGGTDHTDPGPNFPWDYFITAMKGGAPTTRRRTGMYFFAVKDSQYVADDTFERYWSFDNFNRWKAVRLGAGYAIPDANGFGGDPVPQVAAADRDAGVYGTFQGVYSIPRRPPVITVDADLSADDLAEVKAASFEGAKEGAEEAAPTHEELVEAAFEGAQRAEDE